MCSVARKQDVGAQRDAEDADGRPAAEQHERSMDDPGRSLPNSNDRERVDDDRPPVRERGAQARAEAPRVARVLEHDERRREPQREERRQRDSTRTASPSCLQRAR